MVLKETGVRGRALVDGEWRSKRRSAFVNTGRCKRPQKTVFSFNSEPMTTPTPHVAHDDDGLLSLVLLTKHSSYSSVV